MPLQAVWLSNPLLGLIDTSIVGLGSTLELAALSPATSARSPHAGLGPVCYAVFWTPSAMATAWRIYSSSAFWGNSAWGQQVCNNVSYALGFLGIATTTIVARARARGATAEAQTAVQQSVTIAAIAGLAFGSAFFVFATPIIAAFTGSSFCLSLRAMVSVPFTTRRHLPCWQLLIHVPLCIIQGPRERSSWLRQPSTRASALWAFHLHWS